PSPASRLLISSDWWLSSHSPFFEICISFTSYLSLSRAFSTLSAERIDTSCSVDCPPYSIPTFNFTISFHSYILTISVYLIISHSAFRFFYFPPHPLISML